MITLFANSSHQEAIIPCKKLIQISKSIFDQTKKRHDFYDYMADELSLVKVYIFQLLFPKIDLYKNQLTKKCQGIID